MNSGSTILLSTPSTLPSTLAFHSFASTFYHSFLSPSAFMISLVPERSRICYLYLKLIEARPGYLPWTDEKCFDFNKIMQFCKFLIREPCDCLSTFLALYVANQKGNPLLIDGSGFEHNLVIILGAGRGRTWERSLSPRNGINFCWKLLFQKAK